MSDTPDQIEAVSERGTFRVSKSCETHSGWRLVNVSTAPDGMDSAEVWKCPRCLQEELERRDERIRELEQANKELLESRNQDTERLDWLSESGTDGRLPGRDFSGATTIRDAHRYLLGEGKTLREAIDAARAALSKHGGTK